MAESADPTGETEIRDDVTRKSCYEVNGESAISASAQAQQRSGLIQARTRSENAAEVCSACASGVDVPGIAGTELRGRRRAPLGVNSIN